MKRPRLLYLLLPFFAALPLTALPQGTLAEPTASTYRVAKNLIIPEANFNETLLSDALALFQKESIAADPEKNGINFILKTSGAKEPLVTLSLKKVPLSELLKYLSSMTSYQVKYEEHAIVVSAPESVGTTKSESKTLPSQ